MRTYLIKAKVGCFEGFRQADGIIPRKVQFDSRYIFKLRAKNKKQAVDLFLAQDESYERKEIEAISLLSLPKALRDVILDEVYSA